ncbi:anion permease [Rothia sp. P6271]|uniref:inorganic phosphate transporter n=1 Tax=unclassified Rothia (in: high G+C Gram-positive bacteria) TaxID=2689056 RepID=UPI003AD59AE2
MSIILFILAFLGLTGYLFVTGFHDAPNAAAVPVRTRALTPRIALLVGACLNFLGVLAGTAILTSHHSQWVKVPLNNVGLAILLTAFFAQIVWGLITFWLRMPSSSTHALFGGLIGAVWAANESNIATVNPLTESFKSFILVPFLVLPALVFFLSWATVFPLSRLTSKAYPRAVHKVSRHAMSMSNSAISLIHGIQVGQRALLFFLLMCLCADISLTPLWVIVAILFFALTLAAGTLVGGWRIGHTFAHKMVQIDPFRGAVAQGTTAIALFLSQAFLHTPVSSSHFASASVLGAGINQRFSSVRLPITLKVILTWVATVPAAFCIASLFFLLLSPALK